MCLSMLLADGVDEDTSVFDSARDLLPRVKGAFCLTFTDGHTCTLRATRTASAR